MWDIFIADTDCAEQILELDRRRQPQQLFSRPLLRGGQSRQQLLDDGRLLRGCGEFLYSNPEVLLGDRGEGKLWI